MTVQQLHYSASHTLTREKERDTHESHHMNFCHNSNKNIFIIDFYNWQQQSMSTECQEKTTTTALINSLFYLLKSLAIKRAHRATGCKVAELEMRKGETRASGSAMVELISVLLLAAQRCTMKM